MSHAAMTEIKKEMKAEWKKNRNENSIRKHNTSSCKYSCIFINNKCKSRSSASAIDWMYTVWEDTHTYTSSPAAESTQACGLSV